MNEPPEPVAPGEWQEVQRAYREAPPPVPSAGLDARVRAAVEAELAAATAAPAGSAKVIEFPRWRRVAVPLATAATIVIAVGVTWLQRTNTSETAVLVSSSPVPEARIADAGNTAGPALDEEQRLMRQPQEMLQAQVQPKAVARQPAEAERRAAPRLDLSPPVAAPAAPPAVTRIETPALAPALPAASMPSPAPEAAAASDRLMAAKPVPAPASELRVATAAKAANGALAEVAPAAPAPTLEQVRQLLQDGQREAARAMFKRWREAHAAEAVPDDLKQLAAEATR